MVNKSILRLGRIIAGNVWVFAVVLLAACSAKRERRLVYAPDMFYPPTFETNGEVLQYKREGIFFNGQPVAGTIPQGASLPYHFSHSAEGLAEAQKLVNPLRKTADHQARGAYLYEIHCAVCHGKSLDGNGVLYNNAEGPYPAKPAALIELTQDSDGEMFYYITYGKGMMGPFDGQLTPKQRWQIIMYIRAMQQKH